MITVGCIILVLVVIVFEWQAGHNGNVKIAREVEGCIARQRALLSESSRTSSALRESVSQYVAGIKATLQPRNE